MLTACAVYVQRRTVGMALALPIYNLGRSFEPFSRVLSCVRQIRSISHSGIGKRDFHLRIFTASITYSSKSSASVSDTKDYYSVLKVSPKATAAQIKTAFYRLSIIHHPDKNKGSPEAQQNFSTIAEAYSVLGDKKLRLEYDRKRSGQIMAGKLSGKSNVSRVKEFRERGLDHRFDTWTQQHYNDARLRKQRQVVNREKDEKRKQRLRDEVFQSRVTSLSLFAIVIIFATVTVIEGGGFG